MGEGKIRISHFTIFHNNNMCSKTKANRIRYKNDDSATAALNFQWRMWACVCAPVTEYDKVCLIFIIHIIISLYAGPVWVVSCCAAPRHSLLSPHSSPHRFNVSIGEQRTVNTAMVTLMSQLIDVTVVLFEIWLRRILNLSHVNGVLNRFIHIRNHNGPNFE